VTEETRWKKKNGAQQGEQSFECDADQAEW
jgi:hypothetical protein